MTHAGKGVYPYLPMATKCAMVIFFGGGMNKKLLKHVFGLYSLPIIFFKKTFSLARLRFIFNLQMQYVLPTPFIYIFFIFWCHYP